MIRTRSLTILLCAAVFAVPAAVHAQSASDLFQQALRAERVEGDLEAAIRLYRRVVDAGDRALAARALLRIGQNYERLGREGAEEAYQRLVSEFADQTSAAETARVRLAALAPPAPNMRVAGSDNADRFTVRLVWSDAIDLEGRPTPDGKLLTYADWNTNDLAVRDMATGEHRLLTSVPGFEAYPLASSVSNDGRTVAFHWIPGPWQPQLHTIGIDGTGERLLIENATIEIDYITPFDWTPDDSEILVDLGWQDGHHSIALVSVTDGSIRTVRSFNGASSPGGLSLSPDGRWITYHVFDRQTLQADIFILAADGTTERELISHPALDVGPVWTPDGKQLFFSSDRGGSVDLWALRMTDGRGEGDPFIIRRDMGQGFFPMGFTADGSLFYGRDTGGGDIYTVDFDNASGRIRSTPEVVVPVYQGYNTAPSWSANGDKLAYVSRRTRTSVGQGASLIVRDLATGEDTEAAPWLRLHRKWSHPGISPDGKFVAAKGAHLQGDPGGNRRLRLIDLTDGSYETLNENRPSGACALCPVVFSNDGTALYYQVDITETQIKFSESCPANRKECVEYHGLVRHDLATGERERIYPWDINKSQFGGSWAVSPDETKVVTVKWNADGTATLIRLGDFASGQSTEIAAVPADVCTPMRNRWSVPAWTSDGSRTLFLCDKTSGPGGKLMRELMTVPVAGGEATSTGLVMEELRHISVRPDGSIGFAAGPTTTKELWVMSGVLAETTSAGTH